MSEQISEDDVRRIAALARLGLDDAEVARATKDLQGILQHFSQIQDIDTTDVPMAADASGLKNVVRSDEAHPEVLTKHATLVDAAPDTKDGHVKAKAVFE